LAILRLLTPLLAAADVVLVARLVRHRGIAATLVACTVMACFPTELYAIRGPQLEPVVAFFCLLGAALVFEGDRFAGRRRMLLGGVAFGFAVAIKLPALIPIAVLLLIMVPMLRRRSNRFVGGVVAGLAIPTLPFVILAPRAFWVDAVTTQLARIPTAGRASAVARLSEVTGLSETAASSAVVIAVTFAVAAVVLAAFLTCRRPLTPLEWFAIGTTVVCVVAQFAPAQYYPQYAALVAPFLSLLLGLSFARAAVVCRRRSAIIVFAGLGSAVLLATQVAHVRAEAVADTAALVDAEIPSGACAISNSPVYLFTANRFTSDVAGCTRLTDPAGTFLALGLTSDESVATWRDAFAHADYVLTEGPIGRWELPPGAHVPAYIAAHFRLVRAGSVFVYIREGFAAGDPH
jgi:hypothetical protein